MLNTTKLSAWIKALPNSHAVYAIECQPTGAKYVGSAHKQFIAARLAQELSDLKAGRHHSSLLQKDWDRFGSTAFVWMVRPTESGRDTRIEEYWLIRASNAYADFGGYVLRGDTNCICASIPDIEKKLASSRGKCKFQHLPGIDLSKRIHPDMIRTFCRGNRPMAESKNLTLGVDEGERLRLLSAWIAGALRFTPNPASIV